MRETTVNITFQLTGEKAAAFLALKNIECLENNAELGRSLAIKQLREELKKREIEVPGFNTKQKTKAA